MTRWHALSGAVLLMGGVAFSRDARPVTAAPLAPAGGATRPAASAGVPDTEKVHQSGASLTLMRQVLRDTAGKLEEARRSRDVVKLNCVNEKFSQVKGLLRISEQAEVSLREAVAARVPSTAEHAFTKIQLAAEKVEQLQQEAGECIGQLAFRTDEALSVEVDEPDDLFGGDPTHPLPPPPLVVRPPAASPDGSQG